jgi:hypothetical protein
VQVAGGRSNALGKMSTSASERQSGLRRLGDVQGGGQYNCVPNIYEPTVSSGHNQILAEGDAGWS